ncbi:MAG: TIR domain-containing protein [Acidimicrobiales bacterium]|nr:TIR domain-containing protein [Acidimicrobiales bacterium]
MAYDAFISYSHSADGQLAPAVQEGLQRLAKPWNKRRALRVFRDDTGLSANPALWSSISDALDDSGWFVLFMSPAAAQSEWVGKEISHWLAHRPAERILPVLTEGELIWDASSGDFDARRSTAVHPALLGALGEEPRHLDLRWAQDEDDLDLRSTRFRAAVADLAAPIHGIAKDELDSEDVRLHRRAQRLARGAVAALVLLFIASVGAAVLAVSNAARADEAAVEARAEADRALAAEELADERRVEAEEQRAEAERQQAVAEENLRRALSAEELAELEAERALEEQLRAEEQASIADAERNRAVLAPLCDSYARLRDIEDNRFLFSVGELYETDLFTTSPVTDDNRNSIIQGIFGAVLDTGLLEGAGIVAVEALWEFQLGSDDAQSDGRPLDSFLDDPTLLPPYERDYPVGVGEGPEASYDYYDGFVSLTYDEALADVDFYLGGVCSSV